jgi:CTP-dependent riboflavin kinase
MGVKAYSVNDSATRLVIKALGNPKYTWRYLGGLKEETQLSEKEILASVNWLQENRFITESVAKDEKLWALSQDGRDLLTSLLNEDANR